MEPSGSPGRFNPVPAHHFFQIVGAHASLERAPGVSDLCPTRDHSGSLQRIRDETDGHKTERVYRRNGIVAEADLRESVAKLAKLHESQVVGAVPEALDSVPSGASAPRQPPPAARGPAPGESRRAGVLSPLPEAGVALRATERTFAGEILLARLTARHLIFPRALRPYGGDVEATGMRGRGVAPPGAPAPQEPEEQSGTRRPTGACRGSAVGEPDRSGWAIRQSTFDAPSPRTSISVRGGIRPASARRRPRGCERKRESHEADATLAGKRCYRSRGSRRCSTTPTPGS